jgi:hypothetical protein
VGRSRLSSDSGLVERVGRSCRIWEGRGGQVVWNYIEMEEENGFIDVMRYIVVSQLYYVHASCGITI